MRWWRNWQTHQLEGLAVAIPWGFESFPPHQILCLFNFATLFSPPANGKSKKTYMRDIPLV